MIRNQGEDQEMHVEGFGGVEVQQGSASQVGDPIQSTSSPPRSLGAVYLKLDAQASYGVGFGRSIYGWNQNFIRLPMALDPPQNSF
jgi:hypothetical protein